MNAEMKRISLELNKLLTSSGDTVSTAESCTGGSIAAALTAIPGSSAYVCGGIVAYTNDVKVKFLHVKQDTIDKYTVYSEQVVREMVKGCCEAFGTTYAVATSGVAGPGGGTEEIPVGTVWMAVGTHDSIVTETRTIDEGREKNIEAAAQNVLKMLLEFVNSRQSAEIE